MIIKVRKITARRKQKQVFGLFARERDHCHSMKRCSRLKGAILHLNISRETVRRGQLTRKRSAATIHGLERVLISLTISRLTKQVLFRGLGIYMAIKVAVAHDKLVRFLRYRGTGSLLSILVDLSTHHH